MEKDRGQRSEIRGQRTEGSTTLSFPHAFSGNPEDRKLNTTVIPACF
ncbi:MAG: hypothetical protein KBH82_11130 [Syntrophorhabdaceae bacterium]|nr:hypothetical protein [Syntrophorhabdaceae bacterium]MDI9560020.1 hypothetical protein [Pseudomonadota bacterium]